MKNLLLPAIAGCALLFVTTGVATADPITHGQDQHFDQINEVVIDNFTGLLEVRIEGKETVVNFERGKTDFPFDISREGKNLTLAGEERPHNYQVRKEPGWPQNKKNALSTFLKDYPLLTVSIPKGTTLVLDHAITVSSIGDLHGDLTIDGGYVEAVVGDVTSADLNVHSSGNLIVGTVRDELNATIHGSGDITATSAGTAILGIHGSGDINTGAIKGDVSIQIHGSGDVGTGNIAGDISAKIHGSGDIFAGTVSKGGDFSVHGSGDIMLLNINGPVDAQINGSGDIEITHGHAKNLSVNIGGSGSFFFGGESTNLNARVHGSGNIEVERNTGSLNTSGRGTIRVNGVKIKRKH